MSIKNEKLVKFKLTAKTQKPVIQKVLFDASKVNIAATNDTVELFHVPAGWLISKMWIVSENPEATADTVNVGIKGGTLNKFFANVPLNAAQGTCLFGDGAVGTTSVFIPHYCAAESIVQISGASADITVFKGVFCLEMVDSNRPDRN